MITYIEFFTMIVCRQEILFIDELKKKRKFALRLGRLAPKYDKSWFTIKPSSFKKLCNGKKQFDKLKEDDFNLSIE